MEELKKYLEELKAANPTILHLIKEQKTVIYINGIRASKKDLKRLIDDLKNSGEVEIKTTKKGNTAITTKF